MSRRASATRRKYLREGHRRRSPKKVAACAFSEAEAADCRGVGIAEPEADRAGLTSPGGNHLSCASSRRSFLRAGLAVPLAGVWPHNKEMAAVASDPASHLRYQVLGKTGLKVTTLGFGSASSTTSARRPR